MNLSKQAEKELLRVYNSWWESYLNGDIPTYDSFLDDDFRFVGSTDGEEFLNRKGSTSFFEATADQLAGKAKLDNIIRTIEPIDSMVLITDLADAYVLDGKEWVYYARFRFTSLMRKTSNGWRFFYQHFSTPDVKADEGETLGIDKISSENLELRNAIKRRTAELEIKNRELEVEAALERIRAQVTAMSQSSDLLDIVVTMRTEFVKLGHEAHYFWHMRWLADKYQKAMTSGEGSRIGMIMELPRDFHSHYEGMTEWENNKEPIIVLALETEIAVDYIDKMIRQGDFQQVDPNAPSLDDVRHIGGLTFVSAKTSHGEIGYSLPGVVKNPPKEDLDILVRFAGAFDLAHKRFEDLQKSEKQAREVQIELGLEKVRSRAMAMQDSSELQELIHTVHEEFSRLNLPITGGVFVAINNELIKEINCWGSGGTTKYVERIHLPFLNSRIYTEFISKVNKGSGFFTEMFSNQLKKKFFKYLFRQDAYLKTSAAHQKELMNRPGGYARSCSVSRNTSIFMINHHGQKFSKDDNEILIRFGKVFEQTYTRFLDLQKAEAQAREAKIEAALEKVRARAMAMHKADELGDTALLLFSQVTELGFHIRSCGFLIMDEERRVMEDWSANLNQHGKATIVTGTLDYDQHPILTDVVATWHKGNPYIIKEIHGEDLQKYYEAVTNKESTPSSIKDKVLANLTSEYTNSFYFKYGMMYLLTPESISDKDIIILKRFAGVFKLTYRRFLDIQNAETQAREAEIELGLERVRAKTMAMHKSEELLDVASVMFQQIKALGVPQWNCGFNIWEKGDKECTYYPGSPDGKIIPFSCKIPLNDHPVFRRFEESKKRGEELLIYEKEGEEQKDHYEYMLSLPGVGDFLRSMMDADFELPEFQVDHVANFAYGNLLFITYEHFPEMHEVFKRFAKVFEQTYTRFLDLKKAEEQAREATIEAALERVRARSMAMHRSKELTEVAILLQREFKELGINQYFETGYIIIDEESEIQTLWMSDFDGSGIEGFTLPLTGDKILQSRYDAWKRKESVYCIKVEGEGLVKHINFVSPLLGSEGTVDEVLKDLPDPMYLYSGNFSNGFVTVVTESKISNDQELIIERFSKVFEQTYTRFLDLQKAEAQAKEAQIEAALERIRSKSMSMISSKGIGDTVATLFDELVKIGHSKTARTGIGIFDDTKYIKLWSAITDQDEEAVLRTGQFDMSLSPSNRKVKNAWKRGDKDFYFEMKGPELIKYYKAINESTSYDLEIDLKKLPEKEYWYQCYFKYGLFYAIDGDEISEETKIIFTRFSQVFEQVYTRFLDLKKAENQAREAQIETSLERVRSRSIGMQNSEELKDVIQVIFDQLGLLNINAEHAGIVVDYKAKEDWHFWVAETQDIPSRITVPYLDSVWDRQFTEAKKKRKDFFTTQLNFEEKNKFYKGLLPHIKGLTKKARDFYLKCPGLAASTVVQDDIGLYIENFDGIPYSKEENSVLRRFGMVFQQTYTRFLDLQKAEAQVREAQIEAALEKVRSRTMAMQKGEELKDVVVLLYKELIELGVTNFATCGYVEINEETKRQETWVTSPGGDSLGLFYLPLTGDVHFDERYEAWKKQQIVFHQTVAGKEREKHLEYAITTFNSKEAEEMVLNQFPDPTVFYCFNFSHGYLHLVAGSILTEEEETLLARFTKVFEQTYARFLDLKKAEAQAREAQIETALERVRSRTMAMHNSSELAETAAVLFQQLKELGVDHDRTNIGIVDEVNGKINFWLTTQKGNLVDKTFPASIDESNTLKTIYKGYIEKRKSIIIEQKGVELKRWISFITNKLGIPYNPPTRNEIRFQNVGYISEGMLIATSTNPLKEESVRILERFAAVFEQTYTRFLDLQKAEAQAIEARIEAALEKVRSRSLAMQKPEELQEVVAVVAEKLQELGVIFDAGGVILCTYFPNNKDVMHWIAVPDFSSSGSYFVPYFDNPIFNDAWDSKIKGDAYFSKEFPVKVKNEFFKHAFENSDYRDFPDDYKQHVLQADKHNLSAAWSKNSAIIIPSLTGAIPSESDAEIMKRFAKVFEQAYIRFMDLQKAEAQAREAQIEAALERTRNQSMQMQHSDEIKDLSKIFHEQLLVLNIPSEFSYVWLPEEDKEEHMFWATWSETAKGATATLSKSVVYPLDKSEPYTAACYNAWASEEQVHITKILPEETVGFFSEWKELLKGAKKLKARYFPEGIYIADAYMKYGCFGINIRRGLQNDEADILHRFAIEFERAYTRFLDLKRAEAQTREVQIEAALERVRSKTMAMHSSSDVKETVKTFFDEVLKLGIDKTIRCGIGILEGHEGMETWSANATEEGEVEMRVGMLNMNIHPMLRGLKKAWKTGEKGYSYYYTQKDVLKYYTALNNEPEYPFNADLDHLPKREYHNSFFFSSGIIFAFSENPLTDESSAVLHRFAEVFGQTYRRYLDLRKAEAQAKEAQIEAALEKVRSRTMAMQSSSELVEAANLLFNQIRDLDINAWSAGYNILSEDKTQSRCWMSSEDELQDPFPLFFTEEASFIEMGEFLKSNETFFVQELGGKALKQHYDYMISIPELEDTFKHIKSAGLTLPEYQINHLCKFKQGFLLFITYEKSLGAHDIFKRFTKVFEQTYTRFLDLKKAESQSKESKIELALERVRASTMAMHDSEQLAETAQVLFEQFDLLGIIPDRISIAIYNENKRIFELWATDQSGILVDHVHDFSIEEPTCMAKTYKAWKNGSETFVVDLKGKELEDWVRYVKEEAKMELDESEFQGRRVQHAAFFSQGYLLLSSHLPISDETLQLLVRFTKVFQQTYTRFLDLQKAETQAREAVKRASVDRVRAEIASMRTGTDLNRITPLIWNELTTLDVPFIRCGVFIMDEETKQVQTHLSTPDGKAIASFELPFENTAPLEDLVLYWRKNEMYTDYWDESAFIKSINTLMERGKITSSETYMTENKPTSLYLHFLPFLQGMLYVGSEISLNKDELSLVQNLADAFSSAYARYEDFNKLELANIKIEKTLVDLKQAQSQLIQSEKMASLGELTAGIAHEIQNPLNFVNNFSEVSQELMQEMYEEINNGDLKEALEIGNDIEQNLEKIHHHGKRASEIVKGMLQHSRSSSGARELTDINALTDEYLRLAYHGLRAKDKTFNATMETHFDEKLTKIEVIPQDIGRVILNLITNAFYAVDQKNKQEIDGYEPKVTIHTKRTKKGNEIKVTDNGNGIPQKVLDKIFQPFFTTKPTGQGTGLGLSLSYDIITAHGGELKVETKEGVGTTFIIQLTTH